MTTTDSGVLFVPSRQPAVRAVTVTDWDPTFAAQVTQLRWSVTGLLGQALF